MKTSKNKRAAILGIILLGLLVMAYKTIFVSSLGDLSVSENIKASERVGTALKEVENIKFDLTVLNDVNFKSLRSIEIPLPSLPIGKKNPFLPN